jgi:multiple sugar transport system substrate-binding protein
MPRPSAIFAILGVAALLIGACAPGGTGTPAPGGAGAPAALSGEVRISGWSSSPAEDKLLTDSIDTFMKANPGVTVKWEPIAKDYETVLKTNLAAGTEADVFYADVFWVDTVMKTGKLLALDEHMQRAGVKKEDFAGPLLNAFSYQGKVYGIPKDFNTLGLVYNKELFQKAGVKEPTNDWTWDDLKAAAKALTRDGAVGLSLPADAARFVPFLWQAGGDLAAINNAKGVQAVEFYTGFQAVDGSSKMPSELGMGWAGEALAKGKAAMVFEGGWLPAFLNKDFPNVQYGVVQMPKGPSGKANLAFTVSYSVSAKTKNPAAAFALVQHLTGAANQSAVLKAGFALPTRVALEKEITDPRSKAIFDGYAYAKPFNYGAPNTGKINDAINKTLEAIQLKKTTVKEGLDKLAAELKPLLAQ